MKKIRYFFRYQWQVPVLAGPILIIHSILIGPKYVGLFAIPFVVWIIYSFYWGLKKDNDRDTGEW